MGSVTGWNPGVDVGFVTVPLMADPYTTFSINKANSSVFQNTLGTLDGLGRSSAAIALNPGIPADLIGLTLYHATVAFSATPGLLASTNAIALKIE